MSDRLNLISDPKGCKWRHYQGGHFSPTLCFHPERFGECQKSNEFPEDCPLKTISEFESEYNKMKEYINNGISIFASPCENHSGENAPSFKVWEEKYGSKCIICIVDENQRLEAQIAKLTEAVEAGLELARELKAHRDNTDLPRKLKYIDEGIAEMEQALQALD